MNSDDIKETYPEYSITLEDVKLTVHPNIQPLDMASVKWEILGYKALTDPNTFAGVMYMDNKADYVVWEDGSLIVFGRRGNPEVLKDTNGFHSFYVETSFSFGETSLKLGDMQASTFFKKFKNDYKKFAYAKLKERIKTWTKERDYHQTSADQINECLQKIVMLKFLTD